MGYPRSHVRYRPDVGFEMRCPGCARRGHDIFWPLTLEFWCPGLGMTRCRLCWTERKAQRHAALRTADPIRARRLRRERTQRYRDRRRAWEPTG